MSEQEKVIKGLRCCVEDDCDNCPYYDPEVDHDCDYFGKCLRGNMYADALALLNAQEPKLVTNIHKEHNNVLNPNVPWVGKCPKCGKKIEGRNLTRFCKFCGQAVKWE